MHQLTDIRYWTKKLGHLPVQLTHNEENKFIMLNGMSGNFCIHLAEAAENPESYFSEAWSSNTKNFLVINNQNVGLYNWHKDLKQEQIAFKTVSENFEKFYQYLNTNSQQSSRDIVPFIISIFSEFRTFTNEVRNPQNALNLLFVLLASIEDDNIANLDTAKWGLKEYVIPNGFEAFIRKFKTGFESITPNLNLILRHSAGSIFQEAQKEVIFFDKQFNLFGTFSGAAATKKLLYSSVHYTPSYLARSIVENTLKQLDLLALKEIKILDPACGSAEFLIEVLKQLNQNGYKGKVKVVGYDSSETAISTSKFLLTFEKRKVWQERLTFIIENVEDSLIQDWDTDFTIVLMNPPFVSWEQMVDSRSRDAVRATLDSNFEGKPNQASAFFYKAIKHLAPNGVLGSVIPTSIFSADYYKKLRNEVSQIFSFELVGKLGNFVFADALTDISIIIGKKTNTANLPTIVWTRNEKGIVSEAMRELRKMQYEEIKIKDRIDYSIFQPSNFPIVQDTWKPVSIKEYQLIRNLELQMQIGKLSKLSDIFDVQQGIRTGNNPVFKLSASEYLNLPPLEKIFFRPVTENESIRNGYLQLTSYIWFPYDADGIILKTEEDLIQKANFFYENYLYPNKAKLEGRAGISLWWELTRPRNWQFPKNKKLISTEFGNSSSFGIDMSGEFVVERGYALQPKKKFSKNDYYYYLALFSSPFYDKLLSIYSKELAGGKWYDLGKKSTKHIPIPNVHDPRFKEDTQYLRLAELGKLLSNGDSFVKAALDEMVSIYYPRIPSITFE